MDIFYEIKKIIKIGMARVGLVDPFQKPFDYVEFETTAYCNRACSYCPVSMYERPGAEDDKFMSERTFEKLLLDLKQIRFKGKIAPHMYGEPLSDPRIIRWVSRMRETLPDCTIRLVTNGDYLNREKYDQLIEAGVTYFDISKHGPKLAKPLEDLLNDLSNNEKVERFQLRDFYEDWKNEQKMLNTRGGEVKLTAKKDHPTWCNYVIYPVINTFGDVVLCCNDYHGDHKFGNINERSLIDIWRDPNNLRVRRRIFKNYFDLPLCQNCYM